MKKLVITVIGDDRAGLVDALSGVVTDHGGNWERSHMTELAGKFAGVALVRVPDAGVAGLTSDLEAIGVKGLLDISAEEADPTAPAATSADARLVLELIGQDHAGIVHEISHALASREVSIEELETAVVPAPMEGKLFKARAILQTPSGLEADEVRVMLEDLAHDLMVDLDVHDESDG